MVYVVRGRIASNWSCASLFFQMYVEARTKDEARSIAVQRQREDGQDSIIINSVKHVREGREK